MLTRPNKLTHWDEAFKDYSSIFCPPALFVHGWAQMGSNGVKR